MGTIAVGSTNPVKVDAARQLFSSAQGMNVNSGVSAQPRSDEETREGALNRARACVKGGAFLGIGLEGGVMESGPGMLVVNWGALVDQRGCEIAAAGARFFLPEEVAAGVRRGHELGAVIDAFASRKDVRKKEGAVGIFTNGGVTRNELYVHIVRLLAGQYDYIQKN